jgi:hypothetical protein
VIFPRTKRARQRYGRNKVIAILVTFAALMLYLKVCMPKGVVLTKLDWEPRRLSPRQAWDARSSNVIVFARGEVERVLTDSLTVDGLGDTPWALARTKVRTASDHPVVLLYDPGEAGHSLAEGESVTFRGVYRWTTAGGIVRALAADSSAFGVELVTESSDP